ncbi:iron-sulfur cluster insertion protein ErpA [Rhizobiaceae bacterium]|nr:iron-sulfur cluster insertion protein ErpA [Rhizobiaceae bacterium]
MTEVALNEIGLPKGEIVFSDNAGRRVARVLASEPAMVALRVSVEGGGCSGFSYKFDLTDEVSDDDLRLDAEGGSVVIDPISQMYMGGAVIDFVDDLIGQSFQIRNPNATASCGCGTSFAL